MSADAKRLKISGLLTMFAGLAVFIWAIVCAVQSFDLTDALQGVVGLEGIVIGAQGARFANVPSTAGKIVVPALIAFLVAAVCAALSYFLSDSPSLPQIVGIVLVAVLVLLVSIFAKSIVEALKRK